MSPALHDGLAVAARQLLVAAFGLTLVVVSPLGLGWGAAVLAGAWAFGAYTWALRHQGLARAHVKAVAVRAGAVWGAVVAVAYLGIGLVPGQLALPLEGVVVAAVVLSALGAAAAAALSLCGIDATSKVQ